MKKKKLYSTGVREGIDNNYEPFIQIDQQMFFLVGRETKDGAEWLRKNLEVAIKRLIKKAKEQ